MGRQSRIRAERAGRLGVWGRCRFCGEGGSHKNHVPGLVDNPHKYERRTLGVKWGLAK